MFDLVTWPRNPWSIFDELESLQADMNRMLTGQPADRQGRRGRAWRRRPTYPLMNVWSSADGLIIDAELPGVDPKDVDISVMGDELTLTRQGERRRGSPRARRTIGANGRRVSLPARFSCLSGRTADAVKANYKNGVLRLTVPRSEEEKPKKIRLKRSNRQAGRERNCAASPARWR